MYCGCDGCAVTSDGAAQINLLTPHRYRERELVFSLIPRTMRYLSDHHHCPANSIYVAIYNI